VCVSCCEPQPHPNRHALQRVLAVGEPKALLAAAPPKSGSRIVGKGAHRFVAVGAFVPEDYWSVLGMQSHGATGPDGSIYILSRGEKQLSIWTSQGELQSIWPPLPLSLVPHGIHVDRSSSIWIADAYQHMVLKYSTEGDLLMTLGVPYVPSITFFGGPFNMPTGVTTSPDGAIFVSDGYGNSRVHKFDLSGELRLSWGARGSDPDCFAVPHFIEHDADTGWLWVCDRENDRIQIFDSEGTVQHIIDDLEYPNDVAIDSKAAYIAHKQGISVLDKCTLSVLTGWGHDEPYPGATRHPHGIFLDVHGNLYVTEAFGGHQTTKFERTPA